MDAVGNPIEGGIVGTLCSELYNLVVTLIKKTNEFSPLLEAIKLTVRGLASLIPQIEDLNEKLKISNKEIERLKKALSDGVELVGECSNNPKWYKKAKYTDKLTALDKALERELDMLTAHAASDTKEALLLTRKNHDDLVKLARDGRKGLEMASNHGDQLVELAKDGSETFDTVKEIMNRIFEFLGVWISCLIIIIFVWVMQPIISLLGESKRIATAVLDGILSRCKVCKSVVVWERSRVSLVRTYVNLLGCFVIALCLFYFFIKVIRDQYKRGFSLSEVCKLLFWIGCSLFIGIGCKSVVVWVGSLVSLVDTCLNLLTCFVIALWLFCIFILVIRNQYKRGFSLSEVCKLLFWIGCSSAIILCSAIFLYDSGCSIFWFIVGIMQFMKSIDEQLSSK